jgi:hypothetical protein
MTSTRDRIAPLQIGAETERASIGRGGTRNKVVFPISHLTGEGMTEKACTAVAQLTEATAVTWVERQPIPREEMDHGNGP